MGKLKNTVVKYLDYKSRLKNLTAPEKCLYLRKPRQKRNSNATQTREKYKKRDQKNFSHKIAN